ncbi:MAG: VWA domain-containing protein [Phycisphaeraceae bacterium]|nr:VWA domain-containing protein [Phycisphaeraceae bacterium]
MDFSESNNLSILDDSLNGDSDVTGRRRLAFVDVNQPNLSVQATYPGAIFDHLQGYGSALDGTFYSIYDITTVDGGVTNNQLFKSLADNAPALSVNGDLGDNFAFSTIAVTPDTVDGPGVVYAINTSTNGQTELYVLDDSRENTSAAHFLGKVTDKFGAAITDILSMDSDDLGILHLVGFNTQAPNPTTTIGQTSEFTAISENYSPIAMTVTDTGRIFVVNDNDADTDGDGTKDYALIEITRTANLTGGIVTSIINHGIIQDPNDIQDGLDIQNIYTLETDPVTGKLYTVGTRGDTQSREPFEINPINGVAQAVGTLEVNGVAVTQDIKALAAQEIVDQVPEEAEMVWVIDVSGSTTANFAGAPVGDINGDGLANTILDSELASLIDLNQSLIDQGLGSSNSVSIVIFGTSAQTLDMDFTTSIEFDITTTPSADVDGDGVADIVQILQNIQIDTDQTGVGTATNYEAALTEAHSVFVTRGTLAGEGVMTFLSDGEPTVGLATAESPLGDPFAYGDEVAALENLGIQLRAFSVGNTDALPNLQVIDVNAQIVNTTDELTQAVLGSVNVGFVEFLAIRDNADNTQSLIEININPIDSNSDSLFEELRVSERGTVMYDDASNLNLNSNIVDFDFNAQDELIAIEESSDTGLRALLLVDQDNPSANSRLTTDFGAIDASLNGYASDEAGRFYSVFDNDDQSNLQVWTNASVLYTIDPSDLNSAAITPTNLLIDSDANGILDVFDAVDVNGDGLAQEVIATPIATLSRPNPLSTDYVPINAVENLAPTGGIAAAGANITITDFSSAATGDVVRGTITLTANATTGETVTINDGFNTFTFTFGTNVVIGADAAATMVNLLTAIDAQTLNVQAVNTSANGSTQASIIYQQAGLFANYNVVDIAINTAGSDQLYMITDTGTGFALYSVERDADFGSITAVTQVTNAQGNLIFYFDGVNNLILANIQATDFNSAVDGTMYVVATVDRNDAENDGLTSSEHYDENLELFRIDTATGQATSLGLLTDGTDNYAVSSYQVTALASEPTTQTIHAVLRQGAVDNLVTIATAGTATVVSNGVIKIDNANTKISSIDFVEQYERFGRVLERAIVAVNDNVNPATGQIERQLLRIPTYGFKDVNGNEALITNFDPSNDTQKIMDLGVMRSNLVGYSSDSQGIFFSVMNQGDGTLNDSLWSSEQYIAIAAQVQGLAFQTADGTADNFYSIINFAGQATPFTTDVSRPTPLMATSSPWIKRLQNWTSKQVDSPTPFSY